MTLRLQYLAVLAALLAAAPLLAWAARRLGSRVKGGVMLGAMMLGFGEVFDQPAKRAIEAVEREEETESEGEPPLP